MRSSTAFKKPEWLDTAVGIAALCLAVLSTVALLSGKAYFSTEIAVFGALAFGLIVLFIAVFFRPRHSFSELKIDRIPRLASEYIEQAEEVVIVNPSKSGEFIEDVLTKAVDQNIPTSVVGDAGVLHNILDFVAEKDEKRFFESARISGASSQESIFCFVGKGRNEIRVVFLTKAYAYGFRLIDKSLVTLVSKILKRESSQVGGFIGLENVASPRKLIHVAHDEQQRYLCNFQSLQKGYISFYGTEVQSIQSGWVESGGFASIDTLVLTTRPDRLLQRHRYNVANRRFISDGGRIRRVYMVRKDDFSEGAFKTHLIALYGMQMEMGIEIGMLMLDDIPQRYRKDFILYDDSIVLIEDQQATADYALGRSTAYFGQPEIKQHRRDFEAVWNGKVTGFRPVEFAEKMLKLPEA